MRFKSLAKELKGTVKEILGTAFSVGCQVDGRSPKDVSDDIESGEIESQFTTSVRANCLRMFANWCYSPIRVNLLFGFLSLWTNFGPFINRLGDQMVLNLSNTSFSTVVKIDERATNSCFDMRRYHGLDEETISHKHGTNGGTPSQEQSTIDVSSFVYLPHRKECYTKSSSNCTFLSDAHRECLLRDFYGLQLGCFFDSKPLSIFTPRCGPPTWSS